MKKSALLLSIFSLVFILDLSAQKKVARNQNKTPETSVIVNTNPAIFSFGNEVVYKNEFERLLNKNRKEKESPTEKEVKEYLDLYINFKLKVNEALNQQLDTNPAFRSELAGYRKQLANPYLSDKKVTDHLMQEAYERMKTEINGSHILINVSENASPADTLAAFNKISDLRKRIAKGENFDSIAVKYSEDPSAKKNLGKLGWFTVFQMIYPFENVAYNSKKGEISQPFRTQFGYHILRVNDKREARGDIKIGHIMLRTGYGSTELQKQEAALKIDSAYKKLLAGEPFETIVEQYSEDDGSKGNKGVMNWMASLSGYPDEFKDVCFALKADELSKPFATEYGYHIVKYLDKRPLGEFKDVQDILKNKVSRDARSESSKSSVIARIKKDNNYKEFPLNLNEFISKLDTSFLKGAWTYDSASFPAKPLFTIGNLSYNQKDFASYVKANQQARGKESVDIITKNMFHDWASNKCMAYEETILETKYEDFRNIMQEYHDGILLFDLTDRNVWSKAVTDTTGLENYYEANKSKYMWKERLKYGVYTCQTEKAKQQAVAMFNKGKNEDDVLNKMNKKVKGLVALKEFKAENSDPIAEKLWSKKGVVDISNEAKSYKFYLVEGVLIPEPKTLREAKGLVTADYQNYLEKEWIKSLRAKYPVKVFEENLSSLYK